jgi:integrase
MMVQDMSDPAEQLQGAVKVGSGKPRRKSRSIRGLGSVYQRGRMWWIAYWSRGKQLRESSGSTKQADAERLLKRRIQDHGKGRVIDPKAEERLRTEDLFEAVVTDYKANGKRSLDTLEDRLVPLRAAFGLDRAIDVDEARIEKYKAERLVSKARGDKLVAPATVNRELAALRRAFRLGVKQRRISRAPDIEMLAEAPPREGFVEPNRFEGLVSHLPAYLQDFARFDYIVGWRKGALKALRWPDVDRENGRLYLRRAGSKNKKPYVIVLTGELKAIIERRWAARSVARLDGTVFLSEFVFHRDGRPIGDFRKAWATAREQAGLPGLLFHDFRRSAARNLRRAGVGPDVAMKITGHETDSMWRRYSVVKEDDIEAALTATQRYVTQQAAVGQPEEQKSNVVTMSEARR